MALKLDILANTTQAQREVKDLSKALDGTSDALDDLARDSDKAADKMQRSFRDMVQDAGKADKAIDKIGDGGGFSKAGKASGEFKDEALANFSEVTSSFDGSMSSIQDLAQGTLGGLATSGLPGVGLAAGLAATAVGLIGAALQANDEQAQLSQDAIADWAQAWLDAGGNVMQAAQVTASFTAIATDPERYKQAAQNAKDWGVDESTAMRAMAGDASALAVVRRTLNERTEESNRLLSEQETQVDKNAGAAYDLADAVDRGAASFGKLTGEMQAGKDRADKVSDGLKAIINDATSATKEVDALGNEVYTLPDGTEIMIDANTGKATQDVSRFKGDVDGIPETVTTSVKVQVDDSAWRRWQPIGKSGQVTAYVMGTGRQVWQ